MEREKLIAAFGNPSLLEDILLSDENDAPNDILEIAIRNVASLEDFKVIFDNNPAVISLEDLKNLNHFVAGNEHYLKFLALFLKQWCDENPDKTLFDLNSEIDGNLSSLEPIRRHKVLEFKDFLSEMGPLLDPKPIADDFFISQDSSSKSVGSPAVRFTPVGSFEGDPWKVSLTGEDNERPKKTIILGRSFFDEGEVVDEFACSRVNRLIAEGFTVGYVDKEGEYKQVLKAEDVKYDEIYDKNYSQEFYNFLAGHGFVRDDVVVLSDKGVLKDVFRSPFACFVNREKGASHYIATLTGFRDEISSLPSSCLLHQIRSNERLSQEMKDNIVKITTKKDKYTLIETAALSGNSEVAKFIFDVISSKEVPVEAFDNSLCWYSTEKSLPGVSEENINLTTSLALKEGRSDILTRVRSYGDVELSHSVRKGYVDVLKLLLNKGKAPRKDTLIAQATSNGLLPTVELLLAKGLNVNGKEDRGFSPLCIAVLNEHPDVVKLLLDHGANINEVSPGGNAIFIDAVLKGNPYVVKLLLDHGADIKQRSKVGFTAIVLASSRGNLDVVKLLLDYGADIDEICADKNYENSRGVNPLIAAVEMGHADVVELLLDRGADLNQTLMFFPLVQLAAIRGHKNIVDLLEKKGAVVTQENRVVLDNYGEYEYSYAPHDESNSSSQMLKAGSKLNPLEAKGADVTQEDRGDLYVAQNSSNEVKYDESSSSFEMLKAGSKLNPQFKIPYRLRVRTGVGKIVDGKYVEDKTIDLIKILTTDEIKKLKEFETDQVTEKEDFGYVSFYAKTSESNKPIKLLSVNYPHDICGIKTDPTTATITGLLLDAKGFYHIQTSEPCEIEYVLKYDSSKEPPTNNDVVNRAKFYAKRCITSQQKLPKKKDYKTHDEFLTAVFESGKGSCGLKVEAFLHKMKTDNVDLTNVSVVNIDRNHFALEIVNNGVIHYLDLGGAPGELSFSDKKYYKEDTKYSGMISSAAKFSLGLFNRFFGGKKTQVDSDRIIEPKQPDSDEKSKMEKFFNARKSITATKIDAKSLISDSNNPALVIAQNSKKTINQIISAAAVEKCPIFVIDDLSKIDLGEKKIKIGEDSTPTICSKGLLGDFISQAKDSLLMGGKRAKLVIDWSKFNPQQRAALNGAIDEKSTINGVSFAEVDVISVDNKKSTDPSFISRHKAFYDILPPRTQSLSTNSANPILTKIDLEGFDDWQEKLFGDVFLGKDGEVLWNKSPFVEQLIAGNFSFEIENISDKKELVDFIERSKAFGYFEYHGYRIPIGKNCDFDLKEKNFDFSKFAESTHQTYLDLTINQVPKNITLVNSQLFDNLILTKKFSEGFYVESDGLIKQAKNGALPIYITSELSKSQYYVLLNEAQKNNVKLDIYLAPEVKLPKVLKVPQAQEEPNKNYNNLKAAVVLATDSRPIIDDFLAKEENAKNTLEENKDILVLNAEDYSFADLAYNVTYDLEDNKFVNFNKVESAFIERLTEGGRVILKGEFNPKLLESLQPILLEDYARNLMLIIENPKDKIPAHLKWFVSDSYQEPIKEASFTKKTSIKETIDPKDSAETFIAKREKILLDGLDNDDLLNFVGDSGIGKTSLITSTLQDNPDYHFCCGLEGIKAFSGKKKDGKKRVLFVDENNIERCHLTIFEARKSGEKRILYKGEIYEIDKVIFASNPLEFGGRVKQKLFSDDRIQQIHLQPLPGKYILHLLQKEFSNDSPEFKEECEKFITQYQKKLGSKDEITIREVQQMALNFLLKKDVNNEELPDLKTARFTSTNATNELEKLVADSLKIRQKQKDEVLPSCGTPGVLIEGMPGIGKSALMEAYLEEHAKGDYIKINGSKSTADKKSAIINAFEQGKIIWIDELDSFIGEDIEKCLNLALSGQHPDETKRDGFKAKAGFSLFATSNGIAFEGRKLIGPALRHRLVCPTSDLVKPHDVEDVEKIISAWSQSDPINIPAEKAKKIAKIYVELPNSGKNIRELKAYCVENSEITNPLQAEPEEDVPEVTHYVPKGPGSLVSPGAIPDIKASSGESLLTPPLTKQWPRR